MSSCWDYLSKRLQARRGKLKEMITLSLKKHEFFLIYGEIKKMKQFIDDRDDFDPASRRYITSLMNKLEKIKEGFHPDEVSP
jgi:hypothetical protein